MTGVSMRASLAADVHAAGLSANEVRRVHPLDLHQPAFVLLAHMKWLWEIDLLAIFSEPRIVRMHSGFFAVHSSVIVT